LEDLRAALEQALAQGLTRRHGLLRPRIARAQSRAGMADLPADAPVAHTLIPADRRTALDRRALVPRRAAPAQRTEPESRLLGSDALAPAEEMPAPPKEMYAPQRRFPLPRAVWAGCVLAGVAWLVADARPGAALLLLAAAVPLLLMGTRPGVGWLTAALAPLLGLAGLAGAYPALAGQASRWSERAALGALGYWWLILAEPLLAGGSTRARLWLGAPVGLPPHAVWEGSLDSAATHVIAPALTTGLLFGALLWAAAAAVLPWIMRGSSAILDTIAAVVWAATIVAATPYFDAGLSAGAILPHPRGALLGASLAGAIAIAAGALRGPVRTRHP
jgi:hypothetical protein